VTYGQVGQVTRFRLLVAASMVKEVMRRSHLRAARLLAAVVGIRRPRSDRALNRGEQVAGAQDRPGAAGGVGSILEGSPVSYCQAMPSPAFRSTCHWQFWTSAFEVPPGVTYRPLASLPV